jgi:LCP family protein required for cell wall assembly
MRSITLQKKLKFTLILFSLLWLLSACNFPTIGGVAAPAAVSMGQNLLFSPVNPTSTATPFQPIPPTATYLPTETAIPPTPIPPTQTPVISGVGDFPGPSVPPSRPIPPPVGRIPQPKGQVNILLLGSDQRYGTGGFRTDTILLLTLNPVDKTINLTSFPRDLYVYIPGWTMQRINTALAHGGFETIAMTFEYNLGVRPDHFILINFWSFVDVIDSLGGIDVYAAIGLSEYIPGRGWFTIPAGLNHMDGDTALYYTRSRKSTSDFDRNRRQQEVLTALLDRLMSLYSISKVPELFKIYTENVTTDLKLAHILPLVPIAANYNDPSMVQRYYIGRGQVTSWTTPTGASVLLPNRDAVLEIMRQALNSP